MVVFLLKKLSNFIIKRNGYCLYSEYQLQKNDSLCASYCLYIIYLTKIVGIDFKFAVLDLYYQRFSSNYNHTIKYYKWY